MSTTGQATQACAAMVLSSAVDFRLRVKEATLALEGALMAAEMLATHGIVESLNYVRLIDLLRDANSAVDQIGSDTAPGPTTMFPTRALAEAYIEQNELGPDHA